MEFTYIVKKINDDLTDEEKVIFDIWYAESEEHRAYFQRVKDHYFEELDTVDVPSGWEAVSGRIAPRRKHLHRWKYAAVITALLLLGSLFFLSDDKTEHQLADSTPVVEDSIIHVGTDKAVLTLENGSEVVLDRGQSYKSGYVTSNGKELSYHKTARNLAPTTASNVLTIPRGGQFLLVLSDGTKVWLNSESKLRYPVAFDNQLPRQVELLYGEAYFDVSPSTEHHGSRFLVSQQNQTIEVLGTEFNVQAYRDNAFIATTLVEGKIVLKNDATSKTLSPGEQSQLNVDTREIQVTQVDIYNEISWKNGLFSFKHKPLEDIMAVLSRWYDVEVVFGNEDLKKMAFTGIFRKSQRIEEVLEIIENTGEVKYTVHQKTIIMK